MRTSFLPISRPCLTYSQTVRVFISASQVQVFMFFCGKLLTRSSPSLTNFLFRVTPDACNEDDPDAEADSPDLEPGTEMDQGGSECRH